MTDSSAVPVNFYDDLPWSNRREVILGLVISFLITSWICVFGRLYTRLRIVRDPGWDDLCVGCYIFLTTAGTVSVCLSINYGLGQHVYLLTGDMLLDYLKVYYVMNACYVTATTFIKLALLLQYLRVYGRGNLMYKIAFMTAVFTGLWGFSYSFLAWVPCIPAKDFWELSPNANCFAYGSPNFTQFVGTYESHTATNMILDFIVLLIPMPLLFKKNTDFRQRLRVLGLLMMGSIVIMLAIWRLATIIDHQAATWPIHDPTWYAPISIILAVLEIDAAAICASIPIFWPVLEQKWGRIFITQEIKITRETRYMEDEEDEHRLASHSHTSSRVNSEAEFKAEESARERMENHYQDSYVMKSVDPLRSPINGMPTVEAMVRNESVKRGKKWLFE